MHLIKIKTDSQPCHFHFWRKNRAILVGLPCLFPNLWSRPCIYTNWCKRQMYLHVVTFQTSVYAHNSNITYPSRWQKASCIPLRITVIACLKRLACSLRWFRSSSSILMPLWSTLSPQPILSAWLTRWPALLFRHRDVFWHSISSSLESSFPVTLWVVLHEIRTVELLPRRNSSSSSLESEIVPSPLPKALRWAATSSRALLRLAFSASARLAALIESLD